jgi:hypothetical protein
MCDPKKSEDAKSKTWKTEMFSGFSGYGKLSELEDEVCLYIFLIIYIFIYILHSCQCLMNYFIDFSTFQLFNFSTFQLFNFSIKNPTIHIIIILHYVLTIHVRCLFLYTNVYKYHISAFPILKMSYNKVMHNYKLSRSDGKSCILTSKIHVDSY